MRHQRLPEPRPRAARRPRPGRAHDRRDRAPRSRRERLARRRPRGARPPPAVDHRPVRRRRPADDQRGRHRLDHLQRRDLQLPRSARGARGPRPCVPQPLRHRGARPRLRGVGRRPAGAPLRDVRLRHLGRAQAAPLPRARPAGQEAALLPSRARAPLLWFGGEIAALRSGRAARAGRGGAGPLPEPPLRAGGSHRLRPDPQAAACLVRDVRERQAERAPLLADRLPARARPARRRRAGHGLLGAAAPRGEDPADVRRAARRVPLGRARLLVHRSAHGRPAPGERRRSREELLGRLPRRGRVVRAGSGPPGGARPGHRPQRGDGDGERLRRSPPRPGLAPRRAGGGRGLRAALLPVEAHARGRDRGALWRGRRRGARRLPDLPDHALPRARAASGRRRRGPDGAARRPGGEEPQGAQVPLLVDTAARGALPRRLLRVRRRGEVHPARRARRDRPAAQDQRTSGCHPSAPRRGSGGSPSRSRVGSASSYTSRCARRCSRTTHSAASASARSRSGGCSRITSTASATARKSCTRCGSWSCGSGSTRWGGARARLCFARPR